jgi:chromosome segregation ATPase
MQERSATDLAGSLLPTLDAAEQSLAELRVQYTRDRAELIALRRERVAVREHLAQLEAFLAHVRRDAAEQAGAIEQLRGELAAERQRAESLDRRLERLMDIPRSQDRLG